MRNGFKIVDIDTHVNPSYDTLVKYLDPGARSHVAELEPFVRTRGYRGETATRLLTVAFPARRLKMLRWWPAGRARWKAV